jgi:hypothetical protein
MVTYKYVSSINYSLIDKENYIICDDLSSVLSRCLKYEVYSDETFLGYLILEGSRYQDEVCVHYMIAKGHKNAWLTYCVGTQLKNVIKELVSGCIRIRAIVPPTRPKIIKFIKLLGFKGRGRHNYTLNLED